MRITFVAEHYPPEPGGVATSAQRVARELVRLGHQVEIMCFDSTRPLEGDDYTISECDNGVVVHRIGPFFLRHPSLSDFSLSEKMRAIFRRRALAQMARISRVFRPDVVLSFYLLNSGFLARFLASQLKVPCFVGVRGNDIGLNIFHVERFAAIQWIVQGAQGIACVNNHLFDKLLMTFPGVSERATVIPNGVPVQPGVGPCPSARKTVIRETGWRDSDMIAVFIGTLREKKGIVPLLHAVRRARQQVPIRLLVVGPDIGAVERRLCGEIWNSLKAEGAVYLTGQVARSEVLSWTMGGDLMVMPSVEDGLANGLLEGMSVGLCPIVTEIFADVVANGETGVVVPAGDHVALAEEFAAADKCRVKLATMGQAARDYVVRAHSSEREARSYLDFFNSLG